MKQLLDCVNHNELLFDDSSIKNLKFNRNYLKEITENQNCTSSMLEIETIHHKIVYLRELKIKLRNERMIQYQYDLISLDSTLYDEEEYQLYKTYKNNNRKKPAS